MTVVAHTTREESLDTLTKPIRWAGETAAIIGAMCLLMMFDQSVSWETIAIVATGGMIASSVLILWGYARIMNAARGRG